jgi:hypothetical protein
MKTIEIAINELKSLGLSEEEIAIRFDPADWALYLKAKDPSRLICYPKGSDSVGNEILGIKR